MNEFDIQLVNNWGACYSMSLCKEFPNGFDSLRSFTDMSIIWRYMDFWKFTSTLEKNALYFCRADLLGDNWEGCLPIKTSEADVALLKQGDSIELISQLRENYKKKFVSCWHANENENYAMWKVYTNGLPGSIAIKSTIGNLRRAFVLPDYRLGDDCDYGKITEVIYCNLNATLLDVELFSDVYYKRMAFHYENEIRLISPCLGLNIPGINTRCRLDDLILEVIVSPGTQDEFISFLKKTLKMYGLENVPVRKSGLDEDPPQIAR